MPVSLLNNILRARCVIVQKRKRTVKALASADMAFTIAATFDSLLPAKRVKNLAIIMKTGFPGGCPISSLYDEAMNSPQSHRLAVGSMVMI